MTGIHRSGSVLFACALMFCLSVLAGCKGGGSSGSAASSSTAKGSSAAGAPTITGSPAPSAAANSGYSFKPTANDPDGDTLSFQIQNKPVWATFNTVTGELSGTPTLAQVGAFADILISTSDGKSSASLSAFSITVSGARVAGDAGVTLSWTAPTQKSDGSPLTNLAGFVISFGKSQDALSRSVTVDNPSVDRYVFDTLASGTYYFGVRAISASGDEGELSQIVSKVVS